MESAFQKHNIPDSGEKDDETTRIECLDKGNFQLKYNAAKVFHPHIFGDYGSTMERLETQTNARVDIPLPGSKETDITITAPSRMAVCSALAEIKAIIESVKKTKPTHFLSIPLRNDVYRDLFLKFKEEVLADRTIQIRDANLFQDPAKLHFCICVFGLFDNDKKSLAVEVLRECEVLIKTRLQVANLDRIQIHLKGLGVRNNNPKKTRVVHVKVSDCGFLQEIANQISEMYKKKGLFKEGDQSAPIEVKLHAALISTNFKQHTQIGNRQKKPTNPFYDASTLLAKYGDYDFGVADMQELHISEMANIAADGFYEPISIIKL